MACRPPIAMSIDREGRSPLRKRWSTAWETRAGRSAQRRGIDRCRLPDEVSRPMPSLEHATDGNRTAQRIQAVYDLCRTSRWAVYGSRQSSLTHTETQDRACLRWTASRNCEPVRQRALTRVASDQQPAAGACRNAPSVAPLLGADLLTMPQAAARAKDELGELRRPSPEETSRRPHLGVSRPLTSSVTKAMIPRQSIAASANQRREDSLARAVRTFRLGVVRLWLLLSPATRPPSTVIYCWPPSWLSLTSR